MDKKAVKKQLKGLEMTAMKKVPLLQDAKFAVKAQMDAPEAMSMKVQAKNKEKTLVDFKQMLQEFRDRTESLKPYTIMQVEDVMFIDHKRLVALEYIFYQLDGNYSKLKRDKKEQVGAEGKVSHERKDCHAFGTDNYAEQVKDMPTSVFKAEPVYYKDSKVDYLKEHTQHSADNQVISGIAESGKFQLSADDADEGMKNLNDALKQGIKDQKVKEAKQKNITPFLFTENGNDAVVEAVISEWKINHKGTLTKVRETNFDYATNFKETDNDHMKLRLSNDKRIISLAIQDKSKSNLILLYAWNSKNLKPREISPQLQESLREFRGQLKDLVFVSKSKYLMLTLFQHYVDQNQSPPPKNKRQYLRQVFLEEKTGKIAFEFDNKQPLSVLGPKANISKDHLRFLGVIPKDVKANKDIPGFIDPLDNSESDDSASEQDDHSETEDYGSYGSEYDSEDEYDDEKEESENSFKEDGSQENHDENHESEREENEEQHEEEPEHEDTEHDEEEPEDKSEGNEEQEEDEEPNEEEEPEQESQEEDYGAEEQEAEADEKKSDEEYSGGEEEPEFARLKLAFFYVQDLKKPIEKEDDLKPEKDEEGNEVAKKPEIKEEAFIWSRVEIKLEDILRECGQDKMKQRKFIEEKCKEKSEKYEPKEKDYFEIPKNWFVKDKGGEELWENKISVNTTRSFKQFGVLNKKKSIYLAYSNLDEEDGFADKEFNKINFPEKSNTNHGRNNQTKDFLFLIVRNNNESIAYCFYDKDTKRSIKMNDHSLANQDVINQRLEKKDADSPDWETEENELNMIYMQSCSITSGDQEVILKTSLPRTKKDTSSKQIQKKFVNQKQFGNFPVFAYNIGLRKMIIQNNLGEGHQFVLELPQNVSFVDFVEWNKFSDFGFEPMNLRIEASSFIVFLTKENTNKKSQKQINLKLNFLIVDPFYQNIQIALFEATKVFQFQNKPNLEDTFVKNIIYSTKQDSKDINYDIKLITQYYSFHNTTTLKDIKKNEEDDDYDDYGSDEYDSEYDSEISDEEEDAQGKLKYEQVPMLLGNRGFIFYVTSYDGSCSIKEINPKNDQPQNHRDIFEIKAERCYGFGIGYNSNNDQFFYFMDDQKIINKLARHPETRLLNEIGELYIKDKDRPNFKVNEDFQEFVVNDKYIISNSKIFYLYTDIPLMNGILDMEELSEYPDEPGVEEDKKFASGPYLYKGSRIFGCVFKYGQTYSYKQRIFQLPSSKSHTLISDTLKKVNMTTFLQNGQILMKVENRFMMFNSDGAFLDEVEFNNGQIKDLPPPRKLMDIKGQLGAQFKTSINAAEDGQGEEDQDNITNVMEEEELEREEIKPHEETQKIDDYNRMALHKMSSCNEKFLFQDRYYKKFYIFSLVNTSKGKNLFKQLSMKKDPRKSLVQQFEFQEMYELDLMKSKNIREIFHIKENDPYASEKLQTILNNGLFNIQVESNGTTTLTYNKHEDESTYIDVYAIVFRPNGDIKDYHYSTEFDDEAKEDIHAIIEKEEARLDNLIKIEKNALARLPIAFQDLDQLQRLYNKQHELKERRYQLVQSEIFNENLLVVTCGRYIKFTKIDLDDVNDTKQDFTMLDIEFMPEVEISKIWPTCKEQYLQIVAKDNTKNVVMIVTWDFNNNHEISMLQVKSENGTKPENYIVKGMNQKMNYFVNKHQIYDLEYNIPLQQSTNNSMSGSGISKQFVNQRKIYEDGSRALSIDRANTLNFPLSRMDILFWMNIVELGRDPDIIAENTSLEQFSMVYDGYSLFHYFASNVNVIEMIHNRYKQAQEDGVLKENEKNVPLVLLHPDKNGKTALDIAIEAERPKSFELMIDLLETFDNFCLSKMMLHSFPQMIAQSTDLIVKFFESCVYIPEMMNIPVIVPWPEEKDEHVFACHTSIISQGLLQNELKQYMPDDDDDDDENQNSNQVSQLFQSMREENEIKERRKTLRPQDLTTTNEQESAYKRVRAEAIDFDWIFKGSEENDNAVNMIMLLSQQERTEIFVTRSIRVFIELMWSQYQPAIVKRVFFPFCAYLAFFVYLSSYVGGDELDVLLNPDKDIPYFSIISSLFVSAIAFVFWLYQAKSEFNQMRSLKFQYLTDYWNIIDGITLFISFMFLIMLNTSVVSQKAIFPNHIVRQAGGFTCFFIWIKIFYWMRLFKSTAYFVTLITATISDIKLFMGVCFIIVIAYANLLFNLQMNKPESGDTDYVDGQDYVQPYTDISPLNSLIATYFIALGEFSYDGYSTDKWYDKLAIWVTFTSATFLLLIVFMNMLIAIMGDTFSNVGAIQEQCALQEQVNLIKDFIHLLKPYQIFKNKKYIIRLCPDVSITKPTNDLSVTIKELGNQLSKKYENMHSTLIKRIEAIEKNNRQQFKTQAAKNNKLQKLLESINAKIPEPKKDEGM